MGRNALTRSLKIVGVFWLIMAWILHGRLPLKQAFTRDEGDSRTKAFQYRFVHRLHASDLNLDRFFRDFASKKLPVIISFTDLIDFQRHYGKNKDRSSSIHTNPFHNMTRKTIDEICGDVRVRMTRTGGSSDEWAGLKFAQGEAFLLHEVLQTNFFEGMEESVYGLFDFSLPEGCPALLDEQFIVPKYIAQDLMQNVHPSYSLYYRDAWPSLFRGRRGSRGKLHKDAAGTSFWMYQIEGRKEWRLLSFGKGNPTATKWPESLNLFNNEPIIYNAVLSPGEMIIVPGNFPHQVLNVDDSLSLAGNVISAFELDSAKREVGMDVQGMPEYYLQLLQHLLYNESIVNKETDSSCSDLPWKIFKRQWHSLSI